MAYKNKKKNRKYVKQLHKKGKNPFYRVMREIDKEKKKPKGPAFMMDND